MPFNPFNFRHVFPINFGEYQLEHFNEPMDLNDDGEKIFA